MTISMAQAQNIWLIATGNFNSKEQKELINSANKEREELIDKELKAGFNTPETARETETLKKLLLQIKNNAELEVFLSMMSLGFEQSYEKTEQYFERSGVALTIEKNLVEQIIQEHNRLLLLKQQELAKMSEGSVPVEKADLSDIDKAMQQDFNQELQNGVEELAKKSPNLQEAFFTTAFKVYVDNALKKVYGLSKLKARKLTNEYFENYNWVRAWFDIYEKSQ